MCGAGAGSCTGRRGARARFTSCGIHRFTRLRSGARTPMMKMKMIGGECLMTYRTLCDMMVEKETGKQKPLETIFSPPVCVSIRIRICVLLLG